MKHRNCKWTYDEYHDNWDTQCGEAFCFITGDPAENKMQFCPYCGWRLVQHPKSTEQLAKELDGRVGVAVVRQV